MDWSAPLTRSLHGQKILFFVFGLMLISPYSDVMLSMPAASTRADMGELK